MNLHTGNLTNRCVGSFEMSCIGRWTTALPNDGGTPRILHGVCVGIMTDFGLMVLILVLPVYIHVPQ